MYASESGFKRYGFRAMLERPGASFSGADFPSNMTGGEWSLYQAIQGRMLPDRLAVDGYRIVARTVAFADLRGSLRKGDWILHQFAVRLYSLR